MPLGTVTHAGNASGTTSATTGSFTPAANSKLFVFAGTIKTVSASIKPTITDTAGLTYIEIGTQASSSDPAARGTLWWAQVSGSPASMTVTAASADSGTIVLSCCYNTGVMLDFENYSFNGSAVGDPAPVLGITPAGTSYALSFAFGIGTVSFTVPSGFTLLNEFSSAGGSHNVRCASAVDTTTPGLNAAWASTLTRAQAVNFELRVAPPVGGVFLRPARRQQHLLVR